MIELDYSGRRNTAERKPLKTSDAPELFIQAEAIYGFGFFCGNFQSEEPSRFRPPTRAGVFMHTAIPRGWKNKYTEPKPYNSSMRWRLSLEENKASHEWWVNLDPDAQGRLNEMERFAVTQVSLLDVLEIFGDDAKPVLKEKLKSLIQLEEKHRDLLEAKVAAANRRFKKYDHFTSWFVTRVLTLKTATKLTEIIKERKSIGRSLRLLSRNHNDNFEKQIDVARQFPILELCAGKLRKVGKSEWVTNCVFHPDKHPSLYVSPSKNVFNCFGCHTSGDVIDFVMKSENLDFKSAVRRLS